MKIDKNLLVLGILLSWQFALFSNFNFRPDGATTMDHSITVFVHGTYPVRKILQSSFARFLVYCPQGLSLAKDLPSYYYFHKMAQGCVDLNKQSYSMDQFYIFGWESERVYDRVRAQAGFNLVTGLQDIALNYFQQYKVIPKIRLIGFSHGGNVVLHTAHSLPIIINQQEVEVEVWLFGTPVQNANKHLVNSLNFKKVYSFYSKKDWLQRMDPQGLRDSKKSIKNFWSDRMFNLIDRCIQVDFTVNGKSISHSYYRSIFKYFPKMQELAEKKSEGMNSGSIAVDLKK
ncbi:hypothetical protein KBC04_01175 [Candidatus Babeliales bacterium]|nr:hypothetical protein [Candidatus Babeliales bacterium]MBP9843662.1 hypothetical protein [Candidatus Babeliales bacterium]